MQPKEPLMPSIVNLVPASSRATWYAVAGALVAASVSWGLLESEAVPLVSGVVGAIITLILALLHSTSPVRQALYGVAAALAAVGAYYGVGSEAQMESLLAIVAPVLGLGTAAATTDMGLDSYVGEHRPGMTD